MENITDLYINKSVDEGKTDSHEIDLFCLKLNIAHPVRDGQLSSRRCESNYSNRHVDRRLPSINGLLALAMRKKSANLLFCNK